MTRRAQPAERPAPATAERWSELVELYEYRVADCLQGRTPRGGRRPLVELREELLGAPLEPALYRRLLESDRQYRAHQKAARKPEPQTTRRRTGPADPWQAVPSAEPGEMRAWQDLRLLAWGDAVRTTLQTKLLGWQREPQLLTLRVLYAALENAERTGQAGQAGRTLFEVPAARDALTDFHDPQVLRDLIAAVAALLLEPDAHGRLERALSQIHEVPFPRHPDDDVLRARILAAQREPLSAQARETLIQALQTRHPDPRDPRERPAIRQTVRELAQSLEPVLSSDPRLQASSVPSHSVLYAAHPTTALHVPDDGADEAVVYLPGAGGMHWRGTDFQWHSIGPQWQLHAGTQVVLLRPLAGPDERQVTLRLAKIQFRAFVSGDYLLLRVQTSAHEELTRLASLGRATALMIGSAGDYAALRLARAAAQHLREGRVDAAALSTQSAARYALASSGALLGFARKGAETLCSQLERLAPQDIQTVLRGCASALALEGQWARQLAQALEIAAHHLEVLPPPLQASRIDLPADGSFVSLELLDDPPLTLHFGTWAVTLRRDFRRRWAAVIPGRPPLLLQDLSLLPLPDFTLVLARQGNWLAAAAQSIEAQSVRTQSGQAQSRQAQSLEAQPIETQLDDR